MCLKSEGIQFPSFVLLSFFPRGFKFASWCFCFFFTRFRKSSFFCFFSLLSLALFFASAPHSKTQEITSVTMVRFVSLFSHILSLSLFSRRRGKGIRVALESALFTAGRFSRARDERRFFFNALRFFCKFWAKKKPSLPRRTSFKRKRRKSREFTLARPRFSRNFTDFTVSLISIAHFSCSRTR